MSPEETPEGRGQEVLAGLLAPLRLPARAIEALDSLAEAAQNLRPMRSELTRELSAMHETVAGVQRDVQNLTERLPDPTRGPLDRARDALTGSGS